MKRLTIMAALAAITMSTAAQADDAPRGRWIGNGHDTPREIVDGKDPATRAKEIYQWLVERGGKSERVCYKSTGCAYYVGIAMPNKTNLSMKVFDTGGVIYCRSNVQLDTMWCYHMTGDFYAKQILDSDTKEWVVAWKENKGKGDKGVVTAPTTPRKTEVEL